MSDSTAPRFLQALANLDDTPMGVERFWTRFRRFFPPEAFKVAEEGRQEYQNAPVWSGGVGPVAFGAGEPLSEAAKAEGRQEDLLLMRNWLREVWTIGEPARKSWKMFLLRMKFHQRTAGKEEEMEEPPPDCGMDRALRFLLSAPDRARFCPNPDCPAPYFLAAQGNRKFCSPACARSGQRDYKQRWWQEHAALFRRRRNKRTKE